MEREQNPKPRYRVLIISQTTWQKMTRKECDYLPVENNIIACAIDNQTKFHTNLQRNYFKLIS